jgi:hypothetical protein
LIPTVFVEAQVMDLGPQGLHGAKTGLNREIRIPRGGADTGLTFGSVSRMTDRVGNLRLPIW